MAVKLCNFGREWSKRFCEVEVKGKINNNLLAESDAQSCGGGSRSLFFSVEECSG